MDVELRVRPLILLYGDCGLMMEGMKFEGGIPPSGRGPQSAVVPPGPDSDERGSAGVPALAGGPSCPEQPSHRDWRTSLSGFVRLNAGGGLPATPGDVLHTTHPHHRDLVRWFPRVPPAGSRMFTHNLGHRVRSGGSQIHSFNSEPRTAQCGRVLNHAPARLVECLEQREWDAA